MEIKQSFLRDNTAKEAMQRLLNGRYPTDGDALYEINRLRNELEKAYKSLDNQTIEVLKKYADLDEKGEFIPAKDRPFGIQIADEKVSAATKEAAELLQKNYKTADVCKKIKWSWIKGAKDVALSPFELESLEPLIEIEE